jgi:single-strand DNA-binding protein
MNKVWIVGRLGSEPQVKALASGAKIMTISVATEQRWTDKNGQKQSKVEWHRCVLFGGIVNHMERILKKGTMVSLEGRLETQNYTGRDGQPRFIVQIRINELHALSGYNAFLPNAPANRKENDTPLEQPKEEHQYSFDDESSGPTW